ncbi:MAG TPA: NAD(P)-dependent oxidoreductase [Acidimicrobiia bacterium]|nr:NAD(P)-dependent oxidoreductase [Acidimicrobiia bacterium]
MTSNPIAFIGLGLMGSRMSRHLLAAGHELRGYDPDQMRLDEFESAGGVATKSPADAVLGCWAAVLSLPTSDVSRKVCLGENGIAAAGVSPLLVYDTTTGRPGDALEIAAGLDQVEVDYSDTTVSGNSEVAEKGELVVMLGGSANAYVKGRPIFEAIGRSHHHVGPVGSASRMKLIVNHALTVHRMALAEALVVAELAGMDLDTALEVLKDSLAYSKAMDVWGDRMVVGDHEFPYARLRQSHKDARLIVEHGRELGATMDLARVAQAALAEGEETGLADMDNSSIMEVVRRRAGIGREQSDGRPVA